MKRKLFLTSAIAIGFVVPAFAEPTPVETFPDASQGQYMQENTRYIGAATADNMDGAYKGKVRATAEYETIDYILNAGQYLPADSENPTTCPAGSFCSGIGSVQYNETSAQGIESCPSGFGSSETGSSSNTQCYRACDINNVGSSVSAIAHATAISGNDYYGSGTDTCVPTACENGWHVKAGTTAQNLTNIIGEVKGVDYVSNDSAGDQYESYDSMTSEGAGISGDPMAFVVDYGDNGIIKGHGRCSTRNVANPWYNQDGYTFESDHFVSSLTDETGTGQYCYCQLDSYTPAGGTLQAVLSPWGFLNAYGGAGYCARYCANRCASYMRSPNSSNLALRAAMFNSVQSTPAMCEANTITIDWDDVDEATAGQNNEETVTYGGDVQTPFKAATKKGKRFKGWKFSKIE